MNRVPFWKLQSVGNDFTLVHSAEPPVPRERSDPPPLADGGPRRLEEEQLDCGVPTAHRGAAEAQPLSSARGVGEPEGRTGGEGPAETEGVAIATPADLSRLAISICDRRFGVGGDGLLAVEMEGEVLRLRMFNPDGTEDFCGNGIRCAAVHAHALGWVGTEFTVRHLDEEVPVTMSGGHVTTTLAPADYTPERVPHRAFGELFNTTVWSGIDAGQPMSLFGSVLTTGSTHTIIPTVQLPDREGFESVSRQIETDPLFPKRTSVIWSQEIGPDRLQILIWERGVGETLGCGTGASAAAVDYLRRKGRGGAVFVSSRGGALRIRMEAWNAPIEVTGTAEAVFSGEYRWEDAGSYHLGVA